MDEQERSTQPLGALSLEELKVLFGFTEREAAAFSGQPLSRVWTVENPVQGDFLVGILAQEAIPAIYQSYRDSAYDGIFIPSRGFGTIITRDHHGQRALTVIEAVVKTIERESELSEENQEEAAGEEPAE